MAVELIDQFQIRVNRKRRVDIVVEVETDLAAADVTMEVRVKFSTVFVRSGADVSVTDITDGISIEFFFPANDMDQPAGLYRVDIVDTNEDRTLAKGSLRIEEGNVEPPV